MNAQNVLDAAQLVATASAATAIVVQLVTSYLGVSTARPKVATAVIVATALTLLYALSGGLLVVANAFALAIAAITIAAAGAGTQNAIANIKTPDDKTVTP